MTYGRLPLFPPACGLRNAMCVPLFDNCSCRTSREECQCVHIRNPACPEEYADVELCVDGDGNLSICVRRPQKSCKRRRLSCSCPPWYH